jgi:hypothetical protein
LSENVCVTKDIFDPIVAPTKLFNAVHVVPPLVDTSTFTFTSPVGQ